MANLSPTLNLNVIRSTEAKRNGKQTNRVLKISYHKVNISAGSRSIFARSSKIEELGVVCGAT